MIFERKFDRSALWARGWFERFRVEILDIKPNLSLKTSSHAFYNIDIFSGACDFSPPLPLPF